MTKMKDTGSGRRQMLVTAARLAVPVLAIAGLFAPAAAVPADAAGTVGHAGPLSLVAGRPGPAVAVPALATLGFAGVSEAGAATAPHASAAPAAAARWKVVKTVRGSNLPYFTAVTATSRTGAWAFEMTSAKPVAWRLSSGHWRTAPFPGRAGERVMSAASTSPSDVWAVTTNFSRSRVLCWNGRRWAVTGSFTTTLRHMVALSRSDAWVFSAFSPYGTWHYNGHHWRYVKSGRGLYTASALSSRSIWAVGGTQVAHWNGRTWVKTSVARLLPPPTMLSHPGLTGIYARSRAGVWAVGSAGR
jgi:hypothetical protein